MAAQQEGKRRSQRANEDVIPSDAPPPVLMLPSTQPPLVAPVSDRDASDNPSSIAGIPDSGEPKLTPAMKLVSGKKRKLMASVFCGYCLRPRK